MMHGRSVASITSIDLQTFFREVDYAHRLISLRSYVNHIHSSSVLRMHICTMFYEKAYQCQVTMVRCKMEWCEAVTILSCCVQPVSQDHAPMLTYLLL